MPDRPPGAQRAEASREAGAIESPDGMPGDLAAALDLAPEKRSNDQKQLVLDISNTPTRNCSPRASNLPSSKPGMFF